MPALNLIESPQVPRFSDSIAVDLGEILQSAGLLPTRQRTALARLLFGKKKERHLTAEMLYEEALASDVQVSLATVYNTLNQFTAAGLLRQVGVDGTKNYFDTNISAHQHFYVENTRELIDIPESSKRSYHLSGVPNGYEVSRIDMIVRLRKVR
jgi:Fur family transcriptional regulator, iron response regulator